MFLIYYNIFSVMHLGPVTICGFVHLLCRSIFKPDKNLSYIRE